MTILLILTDLFGSIGGGQTVYKKIVESNPDIEFFYFLSKEPKDARRPKNATGVPLLAQRQLQVLSKPPFPASSLHPLKVADQYARSVAGQSFDLVDTPDFEAFGTMLRDALAHHQVSVKRIVLSLHGTISKSLELDWDRSRRHVLYHRVMEKDQFLDVDGVYAISPRYIEEWREIADRPVHFIDPVLFVNAPVVASPAPQSDARPNLYCIGRAERRKGNDLFVELTRWIDPRFYGTATHIGEQVSVPEGTGSFSLIKKMSSIRGQKAEFRSAYNWDQLAQLFAEKSVVVLPVRYDTLNLVALEAILSGCPLVVSTKAGVCDYLDRYLPKLPYIKIDFENFYGSVGEIEDLLINYDEYRERLKHALEQSDLPVDHKPQLRDFYQGILDQQPNDEGAAQNKVHYTRKRQFPSVNFRWLPHLPFEGIGFYISKKLDFSRFFLDRNFLNTWMDARKIPSRLCDVSSYRETSPAELKGKLFRIYEQASNPLYRCNFWLDAARIERFRGNVLTAVTYELRILRLMGTDSLGLLKNIVEGLQHHYLEKEAAAAHALYGGSSQADEATYQYLKSAFQENLTQRKSSLEHVEDFRQGTATVAVIVSLYQAASKLKCFLTCLARQTLLQEKGQVEIILVDSGSPDDEYQVMKEFYKQKALNLVYVRSAKRETIQAAWNRGIQMARAKYLVFLGVDETLYPEALEELADELDKDSTLDWVMANSLVTEVDKYGVLKDDVMPYIRDGATKDNVYLETCYLSWVGGMYRKSIHERFGYYDESFKAAGDTEFKNRILPYINVKFIPKMLGIFLNYPEERTTASSRAEIEDLRAWYIHRTPAGIRYAFENRPPQDAEDLFIKTLGYRKSYCQHTSSDLDMATYLAEYLVSRKSLVISEKTGSELRRFLQTMQSHEFMERLWGGPAIVLNLMKTWREVNRLEKYLRENVPSCEPVIKVFNDNRYEQHTWFWKIN